MDDKYWELRISCDERFTEFIADFVADISGEGVEIGRDSVILRSSRKPVETLEEVEALAAQSGGDITLDCTFEEKENIDWIKKYQESIEPVEAGEFYIYPSWYEPRENKINIEIDPALAFGSGHHATTSSCLEAISDFVKRGDRVLDVGCGSGILGLASAKLGAIVELCDTDPLAVESCRENFRLNGAEFERIWEGSADKAQGTYDIILANIVADILKLISGDLHRLLAPGGKLILSGILDTKESQVLASYGDLESVQRKQKDEWVTLIYQKDKNG